MNHALYVASLMLCLVVIWKYYFKNPYSCPFCGTRNGQHSQNCQWRKRN